MALTWLDSPYVEWLGEAGTTWEPVEYTVTAPTILAEETVLADPLVFGGTLPVPQVEIDEGLDLYGVFTFFKHRVCGIKSEDYAKVGGISGYYVAYVCQTYGGM